MLAEQVARSVASFLKKNSQQCSSSCWLFSFFYVLFAVGLFHVCDIGADPLSRILDFSPYLMDLSGTFLL
jgi:hypothetical protein